MGWSAARPWTNETALRWEEYLEAIPTLENLTELAENIAMLKKHQEIIRDLGTASVSAEYQAICVGDAVFIASPMEILTEQGVRLKYSSPFKRTFIVSLSNGHAYAQPRLASGG